jgi:galactose oxidase
MSRGSSEGIPDADKGYAIFKPPYFFNGPRPTITSISGIFAPGRGITVETPDAASITKVRLVRLGAATHGFDQDTRSLELTFSRNGPTSLRVAAPASANEAPFGYSMLFIAKDHAALGPPNTGPLPSEGQMVFFGLMSMGEG